VTILLAVLISGVLLDGKDMPIPNHHITFILPANPKGIEVTTDKDGKFQVDLAPGTYRFLSRLGPAQWITVDTKTTELKLKPPAEPTVPPGPPVIKVIDERSRDFSSWPSVVRDTK